MFLPERCRKRGATLALGCTCGTFILSLSCVACSLPGFRSLRSFLMLQHCHFRSCIAMPNIQDIQHGSATRGPLFHTAVIQSATRDSFVQTSPYPLGSFVRLNVAYGGSFVFTLFFQSLLSMLWGVEPYWRLVSTLPTCEKTQSRCHHSPQSSFSYLCDSLKIKMPQRCASRRASYSALNRVCQSAAPFQVPGTCNACLCYSGRQMHLFGGTCSSYC